MSNESSQPTNNQTYADRLAALAAAAADAVEASFYTAERCGYTPDCAEIAYVNLWDALLNALITHADCDHAELLAIVAGTLQMRAPIPVVTVGPVPIWGVVEDGRVNWNSSAIGRG